MVLEYLPQQGQSYVGLPGGDGETHQGIFDVAYLSSIPNFAIAMGKDDIEAEELFNFAKTYNHPFAIRYPRGSFSVAKQRELKTLELGKWIVEQEGKDIAILSYGQVLYDLMENFKGVKIVNAIFQKPVDEIMLKSMKDYKHIVIYDIYGTKEGFANNVIDKLVEQNYKGEIHVLTVPTDFIRHMTIPEQLKELKLDIESLKEFIKGLK